MVTDATSRVAWARWAAPDGRAPQAKKSGPCSNEKIPPEENEAQVYSYSNVGAKGGSSYSGGLVCLSRTGGRDFGLQNAYVMCDAKDGRVDERSCTTFSGEAVYADYRSARRCTFRCGWRIEETCAEVSGYFARCQ